MLDDILDRPIHSKLSPDSRLLLSYLRRDKDFKSRGNFSRGMFGYALIKFCFILFRIN